MATIRKTSAGKFESKSGGRVLHPSAVPSIERPMPRNGHGTWRLKPTGVTSLPRSKCWTARRMTLPEGLHDIFPCHARLFHIELIRHSDLSRSIDELLKCQLPYITADAFDNISIAFHLQPLQRIEHVRMQIGIIHFDGITTRKRLAVASPVRGAFLLLPTPP